MKGVERSERQGHRGRRPLEDAPGEVRDLEALEEPVDRFPPTGGFRGGGAYPRSGSSGPRTGRIVS